jgi:hypothetical protein
MIWCVWSTARASQTKPVEAQDALEEREQHLDHPGSARRNVLEATRSVAAAMSTEYFCGTYRQSTGFHFEAAMRSFPTWRHLKHPFTRSPRRRILRRRSPRLPRRPARLRGDQAGLLRLLPDQHLGDSHIRDPEQSAAGRR